MKLVKKGQLGLLLSRSNSETVTKIVNSAMQRGLTIAELLGIPKGDRNLYFPNGDALILWKGISHYNKDPYYGHSNTYESDFFFPSIVIDNRYNVATTGNLFSRIYGKPHLYAVPPYIPIVSVDGLGNSWNALRGWNGTLRKPFRIDGFTLDTPSTDLISIYMKDHPEVPITKIDNISDYYPNSHSGNQTQYILRKDTPRIFIK